MCVCSWRSSDTVIVAVSFTVIVAVSFTVIVASVRHRGRRRIQIDAVLRRRDV
jgi:hypothetical protein